MARVKARRAWHTVHVRCKTFFKGQTPLNIESTVSTTIRVFQVPRAQSLRLGGSPSLAWEAGSLKIIMSSAKVSIRGGRWSPAHGPQYSPRPRLTPSD